jgi:hypothetical protein
MLIAHALTCRTGEDVGLGVPDDPGGGRVDDDVDDADGEQQADCSSALVQTDWGRWNLLG